MAARTDYAEGELIAGTIYRVVDKIGAGGMGAVYDVEDTTVGRRYVLKAMHPDLCERKDLARRMQIEARTLGRLSHANIVEVVTAGATADDPPRPFFVMERLEGRSLRAVLESKGQLSLHHAFAIMLDLLSALEHAHAHDVVHRDVKPDNLFLHRPRGAVAQATTTKLLDFGIMRIARADAGETAGRFVGTLRYAAPEQLRGERGTPATDIYAAALVLYEMVAGRGPFDNAGESAHVANAHLKRTAPPLSTFRAVPPALDRLVASALAKDPEARPPSAHAFAEALRAIPDAEPAGAAIPLLDRDSLLSPEPSSRSRNVVIALAIAAVVLIALLVLVARRKGAPASAATNEDDAAHALPSTSPMFASPSIASPSPVIAPPLFDELPGEASAHARHPQPRPGHRALDAAAR